MFQRLLAWDAALTRRLRIAESPGMRRTTAAFLAHSGDSWFWFLGWGAVWLFGTPIWRSRAGIMLLSIFGTAVTVMALKFTIRRRRPEGQWGSIYRTTDPHSFPSGHAARAALLAVLAWGIGPLWLAVALTIWAPLVALARVAMGVHYLSDVLAGATLGLAISLGILISLGL